MQPNITKQDNGETILFECQCHGQHFLEVSRFNDEEELFFTFLDYPCSLWSAIKWWWTRRKVWTSELELSIEDCKALKEALTKHILYYNKEQEEKKLTPEILNKTLKECIKNSKKI